MDSQTIEKAIERMKNKLKPCPFCGHRVQLESVVERDGGPGGGMPVSYVGCGGCYARGPSLSPYEIDGENELRDKAAMKAWNKMEVRNG